MSWLTKPKPYFKVLRNSFVADMEYRMNYYILILSSFITVFMEIAIFNQIYAGREQAGDLHRDQALSFIVLGMLIRSGVTLWTLIADSIDQIRDGSFRKFLIQPLHFPSFFHAQIIGPKLTTWTLSAVALVILKFVPGFGALLPPGSVLPFVVAVAFAYALTWQIYLLLIYVAFWLEEAAFISSAFSIGMSLFTGTLVPLSWFPEGFARAIKLTPFPLIGNFPVYTGLGVIRGQEYFAQLGALIAWLLAFLFVNAILQRSAFRRFEAFGG